MRLRTSASFIFTTGVLLVTFAPPKSMAQIASTPRVYAANLQGPRGLRFGPDGYLYVAEAGTGGATSTVGTCPQVPAPFGPYSGGKTARISKIDATGSRATVAAGFPSAVSSTGDIQGVADVAFVDGTLYAVLAGGGCSHGNPDMSNGIARVDESTGHWTLTADLGDFLKTHPARYESAGDFEPDGVFYSLLAVNGHLLAVEPNHGQIFSSSPRGEVKELIDISASYGHIVPTSIAEQHGSLYVGNLGLFPINPQWELILTISKQRDFDDRGPGFDKDRHEHHIVNSTAGFTSVVAVDFGPDGLLYALELSAQAGFPTSGAGKVVRLKHSGEVEDVVTGLTMPTGMTFGPGGQLYISNFGAVAGSAGQILQYDIQPGW